MDNPPRQFSVLGFGLIESSKLDFPGFSPQADEVQLQFMKPCFRTAVLALAALIALLAIRSAYANQAGALDPSFDPGWSPFGVRCLAVQNDGQVLIGGPFGLAKVGSDGTAERPWLQIQRTNIPAYVFAIAVQSDGKILIGGNFTAVGGQPRNCIARLNGDGTVDTNFPPNVTVAGGGVGSIGIQPDGRILIGGSFAVTGQSRSNLVRLLADGNLDLTFSNVVISGVATIAVQTNGAILVGGHFSSVNGQARYGLARFNTNGTEDSTFLSPFNANSMIPLTIALQANGKILVGGRGYYSGGAELQRLNANGTIDGTFSTSEIRWEGTFYGRNFGSLPIYSLVVQTNQKILIAGQFAATTPSFTYLWRNLARVNPDGGLDESFQNPSNGEYGTDGSVSAMALQSDGKIVIGGDFTAIRTHPYGEERNRIARLSSDGIPDPSFRNRMTSGIDGEVFAIARLTDGKILVGGNFRSVNGLRRDGLARLNTNGTIDATFDANLYPSGYDETGHAPAEVRSILVQSDNKILIGGFFSGGGAFVFFNIARLNPDGSYDNTFSPHVQGRVYAIATNLDGRIYISGEFPKGITRVNSNGSGDVSFQSGMAGLAFQNPLPAWAQAIIVQPDGRVLIGGRFLRVNGQPCNGIARLNASGSLDSTFSTTIALAAYSQVFSMVPQPDGKILVGGGLVRVNIPSQQVGLVRLNDGGTLDGSFEVAPPGSTVYSVALQPDGKILNGRYVGGIAGPPAQMVRLHLDGTMDPTLDTQLRLGGVINAITPQADGRLLIGGSFLWVNDALISGVARVRSVACPHLFTSLTVVESSNLFDPQVRVRHGGDFAGFTNAYAFEWRTLPPGSDGLPQSSVPPESWRLYTNGMGLAEISLQGSGAFLLGDNYFICRARPVDPQLDVQNQCGGTNWGPWTQSQLVPGWIKRVLSRLNDFEVQVEQYTTFTSNSIVSMIARAGDRWREGVPLSAANVNQLGLIQVYESILKQGIAMLNSSGGETNIPSANDALLPAASRLSDLYMLLANEAYADAADPTIGYVTRGQFDAVEPTAMHCFMNQTGSLLEEELALLRGVDPAVHDVTQPPYHNRLQWNFTQGLGNIAYQLNYLNGQGTAEDARRLWPQGHGDAWGHYLTATKVYYRLLRSSYFQWTPRGEQILLGPTNTVTVDYREERNFAQAAAAKARTGKEILNLTYRKFYDDNPANQWRGYPDMGTNRWGVADWASRAGQAALFDWVSGNALLPLQSTNEGLSKIDRTTVPELREVAASFDEIQRKLDDVDQGLNPLGLVRNAIPFDINPDQVAQGKTHFDQIYDRALGALSNAVTVFDYAQQFTAKLRVQADSLVGFQRQVAAQESDFKNRLIEIFGRPYPEDIGTNIGGAYPAGYDGPDVHHFMYYDTKDITGEANPRTRSYPVRLEELSVQSNGGFSIRTNTIPFNVTEDDLEPVKPEAWIGRRPVVGELQMAYSEFLQAHARFEKGLLEYDNSLRDLEDQKNYIRALKGIQGREIRVLNYYADYQADLDEVIFASRKKQIQLENQRRKKSWFRKVTAAVSDVTQGASAGFAVGGPWGAVAGGIAGGVKTGMDLYESNRNEKNLRAQDKEVLRQLEYTQLKERAQRSQEIQLTLLREERELLPELDKLRQLIRRVPVVELELYNLQESIFQAEQRYASILARGQRLLEDQFRFQHQTAADLQQFRYKDMAFRIFRDDALQKFRAAFDFASLYTFLAASAYDYETCFQATDPRAPAGTFINSIIRARSIGPTRNGQPLLLSSQNGDRGLADPLARLIGSWNTLKPQLGFNQQNQSELTFSLRSGYFRISRTRLVGDPVFRETLRRSVVTNLRDSSEFQRFCIFNSTQAVEPGLVIPFSTSVHFGYNFFGWPAEGGDANFNSDKFAIKIDSVRVHFENYDGMSGGLVSTPYVYLIPVGNDVSRTPGRIGSGFIMPTREWKIFDQLIPPAVLLQDTNSFASSSWLPQNDLQQGQVFADLRRYGSMLASFDGGSSSPPPSDFRRLIGRSVWNTRWLLIIPAGALHGDRTEGLRVFIDGRSNNGGVSDIKLIFKAYSVPGY